MSALLAFLLILTHRLSTSWPLTLNFILSRDSPVYRTTPPPLLPLPSLWKAGDHRLHQLTPVMRVILPCFCDSEYGIVFLLCHGFQLLLFADHATLVYTHFSWADFTVDSDLPHLGLSLKSLVSSSSPFKPSLKASQSANSWAKILLPLLDRWSPSDSSRPGAVKVTPWSKDSKLCWRHQPLNHLLVAWIFLLLSSFISAAEGTEKSTACIPVSSTNQPRALKFLFNYSGTLLINIISANLGNQQQVIHTLNHKYEKFYCCVLKKKNHRGGLGFMQGELTSIKNLLLMMKY